MILQLIEKLIKVDIILLRVKKNTLKKQIKGVLLNWFPL